MDWAIVGILATVVFGVIGIILWVLPSTSSHGFRRWIGAKMSFFSRGAKAQPDSKLPEIARESWG